MMLAVTAVGYISCEKTHKWVGTYECEEIYSWWYQTKPPDGGWIEVSGTEVFQTMVEITTVENSILNFSENRNGGSYEAKINSDGSFRECYGSGAKPLINGNLYGDSLNMTIYHTTALGAGSSSIYKGKKIKNVK